jgi:hypothetical protein
MFALGSFLRVLGFILFFLIPMGNLLHAQAVSGTITDESGQPVPFANIYVKGTSRGTATNIEGNYNFKLTRGAYVLVFQHVGYKTVEEPFQINSENLQINVTLKSDTYQLDEVVVTSDGEDPAYAVIREAIKKRKDYLEEVRRFRTEVYVKGLQRLDKVPEKLLGMNLAIDTGIVYLSESISDLSYAYPDQFKEEVISSKVSGDPRAFTWNEAYRMTVSFYENLIEVEEISERGYVSPIARNALLFYEYKLEGTFVENDRLINKIKVIPRRENDPVFQGYIYIVEDEWRIHSTDLMLTRSHQLEFIDSLRVQQVYAPLPEGPWMILSQTFKFQFRVFGFAGSGQYFAVYDDYKIEPDFERKYFTNALITVLPGSNEREDSYWENIRPIPLTSEEINDYSLKDSIRVVRESQPYLDSIDQVRNQPSPGNLFVTGYTYRNSFRKWELGLNPGIGMVGFNTVEGWVLSPSLRFTKRYEDQRYFYIDPDFRYGFSNNRFNTQVELFYYFNRKNYGNARITAGRYVNQLNEQGAIPPLVNTLETLLRENNFIKLFEKTFVRYKQQTEVINGLMVNGAIEWAERRPLFNTTDYRWVNREGVTYSPNDPTNAEIGNTQFGTHQAFFLEFDFRIRFAQKYLDRPDRKYAYDSKYPSIHLGVKKAFSILNADVDYTFLSVRTYDDYNFGLVGSFAFQVMGGGFVQKDSLTFIDFHHFFGNRSLYANYRLGNFQLLDFYEFSTRKGFITANIEHSFNGFIFNKIPLLRKTKIQSVFTTNYAFTQTLGHYVELGYGIEHIFKFLRVDWFMALNEGKQVSNGIRFGFGF